VCGREKRCEFEGAGRVYIEVLGALQSLASWQAQAEQTWRTWRIGLTRLSDSLTASSRTNEQLPLPGQCLFTRTGSQRSCDRPMRKMGAQATSQEVEPACVQFVCSVIELEAGGSIETFALLRGRNVILAVGGDGSLELRQLLGEAAGAWRSGVWGVQPASGPPQPPGKAANSGSTSVVRAVAVCLGYPFTTRIILWHRAPAHTAKWFVYPWKQRGNRD